MKNLISLLFIGCIFLIASIGWGEELYNYGKVWKSWSDYERIIFLWGYQDGVEAGGSKLLVAYEEAIRTFNILNESKDSSEAKGEKIDEVLREIFQPFGAGVEKKIIIDIMNDLYKDSSNTYITFPMIVNIAKKKLEGKKAEDDLRNVRGYQKMVNKLLREMENEN